MSDARPREARTHLAPCGALDCRSPGEVVPVIEVPDIFMDLTPGHIPMRVHIPLAHCRRHARDVVVSDLMADARIRATCETEATKMKRRPNWQKAKLVWRKIYVPEDHQT